MPLPFEIKVIRSARRSISMRFTPDKTLIVRAPLFTPQFLINKFISDNKSWIEKQLTNVATKRNNSKTYQEGEEFLYLGEIYKLHFGNFSSIQVSEKNLNIPVALQFRAQKELNSWYIKQAEKLISDLVAEYSHQLNTSYKSITFSDTRSKWGSCTHDNRLQFNWRLIMTPLLVIRYVVLHELVHTTEKNHSASFWSKVRAVNPSFKQQIKWLKLNGNNLTV